MGTTYVSDNSGKFSSETQGEAVIRCKLFSDEVTVGLCEIRKRELNQQGGFSCFGCAYELQDSGVRPHALPLTK